MWKINPSQEAAQGSLKARPSTTHSESNNAVEVNTQLEGDTMKRRSKYDQQTDANDYDGGMSDTGHHRKRRMAKAKRNRQRKSRSRSRRRRR